MTREEFNKSYNSWDDVYFGGAIIGQELDEMNLIIGEELDRVIEDEIEHFLEQNGLWYELKDYLSRLSDSIRADHMYYQNNAEFFGFVDVTDKFEDFKNGIFDKLVHDGYASDVDYTAEDEARMLDEFLML